MLDAELTLFLDKQLATSETSKRADLDAIGSARVRQNSGGGAAELVCIRGQGSAERADGGADWSAPIWRGMGLGFRPQVACGGPSPKDAPPYGASRTLGF
jgi:hypothetical protein